ncbi:hypothetical protein [Microbacterium sp. NPDC076911]|uniref:hypothetical protein n=1 Tax=Microbacterium sp. NPDC076911 TaxID=3154958 RepID=UPI00342EA7F3
MTLDDSGPVRSAHRPAVVTISVVLIYVSALVNIALGILILLSRYELAQGDRLGISLLGSAGILFGLLILAVASGVSRGSNLSRVLTTVYFGALMVLNIVAIAATDDWDWSLVVQTVAQAFILVSLWALPRSRQFFRSHVAASV